MDAGQTKRITAYFDYLISKLGRLAINTKCVPTRLINEVSKAGGLELSTPERRAINGMEHYFMPFSYQDGAHLWQGYLGLDFQLHLTTLEYWDQNDPSTYLPAAELINRDEVYKSHLDTVKSVVSQALDTGRVTPNTMMKLDESGLMSVFDIYTDYHQRDGHYVLPYGFTCNKKYYNGYLHFDQGLELVRIIQECPKGKKTQATVKWKTYKGF